MAGDTAVGSSYGTFSALIFIFNLVVGTGALALPKAMADAGWLLSVIFLSIVAVFAFISATFVIEAQAAANAVLKSRGGGGGTTRPLLGSGVGSFEAPLLQGGSAYQITERVEVTYMGELLGSPRMRTFFSVMLMIYLYGDLAVYAVAIPTALSSVARLPFDHPVDSGGDGSGGGLVDDDDRLTYSVYLFCFACLTLPVAFLDFQKSAWLQYTTCAVRNSAFFTMVALMAVHINTDGAGIPPSKHLPREPIKTAEFAEFAELYGAGLFCVFFVAEIRFHSFLADALGFINSICICVWRAQVCASTRLCATTRCRRLFRQSGTRKSSPKCSWLITSSFSSHTWHSAGSRC